MNKEALRKKITGDPAAGTAGLQDDWWTAISPVLWKSRGSYLRDLSGEEYLDMCGFFGTSPIRFDHPVLRDREVLNKMGRIAMIRPSLSDFWTAELAEFVDTFRKNAVPPYMHHLFFIDGGALAVENALKAAFDWKVRLNIQKGKITDDPREDLRPLGTSVVGFEMAFHGRSGYTLSLTHTNDPRKYMFFPKLGWHRFNPPVMQFDENGHICNTGDIKKVHEKCLAEIEALFDRKADDIAAVIIEPIQCEGGDRHIPVDFFVALRKITRAYDVLLIYDEVQTGFGTTGKMWAHEHFGETARPDLIAFAKKAQVGGIMANYDIFARIDGHVFSTTDTGKNRLNSTWGGHPADMMRCTLLLEIIKKEKLVENASRIGQYLLSGIRDLCRQYPAVITNARGCGMLISFDTVQMPLRSALWKACLKENLLCLTCGAQSIRFRPHLDLSRLDADQALNRLEKALKSINI